MFRVSCRWHNTQTYYKTYPVILPIFTISTAINPRACIAVQFLDGFRNSAKIFFNDMGDMSPRYVVTCERKAITMQ